MSEYQVMEEHRQQLSQLESGKDYWYKVVFEGRRSFCVVTGCLVEVDLALTIKVIISPFRYCCGNFINFSEGVAEISLEEQSTWPTYGHDETAQIKLHQPVNLNKLSKLKQAPSPADIHPEFFEGVKEMVEFSKNEPVISFLYYEDHKFRHVIGRLEAVEQNFPWTVTIIDNITMETKTIRLSEVVRSGAYYPRDPRPTNYYVKVKVLDIEKKRPTDGFALNPLPLPIKEWWWPLKD